MSYSFAPPPASEEPHWDEEDTDQLPPKPLSGPGTSRQTRRLQLRNAGFRAAAVPTRKVTPKSVSSGTTNWSSMSGLVSGSDAENFSPLGVRASSAVVVEKRRTSGALQESGSGFSTLTRPKKTRPRVSSVRAFGQMAGGYDMVFAEDPVSPPASRNAIRAKSVRSRAKVNKTRRSMSGEAKDYIDHLEAELASAQSQLQAINSPSVTRQQSSKLRTLNTETRQLQDELAEWEARYEQRVQEIVDEHVEIEASLRSELRKMEQDAEEAKYRIEELGIEVAEGRQNVEAVEAANVNLERRLEIMSEILATSPSKIDLHAVPGTSRKHQRPKSMLPRFPTASSLLASPERQPRTQPASPVLTFADNAHPPLDALETSFSQSELASDAESIFSEAPSACGSTTSLEHSDAMPSHNPWTLHAVQSAKARPARRMRRFGPGSHGPKSLILPSTSYYEYMPASAPPLERSETTPAFAFPFAGALEEEADSPSSLFVRRRASTTADETTLANLAASPFGSLADSGEEVEESELETEYPMSAESQSTSRNFSSLGSVAGRNLMDELCAVRTPGTSDEPSKLSDELSGHDIDTEAADEDTLLLHGKEENTASLGARNTDDSLITRSTRPDPTSNPHTAHDHLTHPPSIYTRLRHIFTDLYRSPLAITQHLIQRAQLRMQIHAPLRTVQWWLVGALLGPMARRHFLATSTPSSFRAGSDLERQPLLRAYTAPVEASDGAGNGGGGVGEEGDGLVYGTMYHTPPGSPSGRLAKGEKGKQVRREGCAYHYGGARHSPWAWIQFSITLAVAVGVAFKDGPASLLRRTVCGGCRRKERREEREEEGRVSRTSLA
ncbi:hypothetical protein LTR73_002984 [Friedmanniomyces endolithicus]|nr:hypothetical protein LTR73_002984 [Friedmanniomyces endolithicus]